MTRNLLAEVKAVTGQDLERTEAWVAQATLDRIGLAKAWRVAMENDGSIFVGPCLRMLSTWV